MGKETAAGPPSAFRVWGVFLAKICVTVVGLRLLGWWVLLGVVGIIPWNILGQCDLHVLVRAFLVLLWCGNYLVFLILPIIIDTVVAAATANTSIFVVFIVAPHDLHVHLARTRIHSRVARS